MIVSNIVWGKVKIPFETWENCYIHYKENDSLTVSKKDDETQNRFYGGARCTLLKPWGATFEAFEFNNDKKWPVKIEAEF